MRHMVVLVALCVTIACSAGAQEPQPSMNPPAADKPKVQVIEDQAAGVIRVMIGDQTVLLIDSSGLHVNGDISYSGTSTDYGPEGFAAAAGKVTASVHAP